MPALNGMTERRETSDLQPRTEDRPMKLTPGTAGKDLTELLAWEERPRARSFHGQRQAFPLSLEQRI